MRFIVLLLYMIHYIGAENVTIPNQKREMWAGDYERLLYDKLAKGYNKLARPVRNMSEPVLVLLGIDFQQIIDIDEKSQIMNSNVWLRMSWVDIYLTWNPEEYGNIREVRLPIDSIWKPDVLLYNSIDQQFDSTWPVNAVVLHTGNVTWIPPAIIRSSCTIDISWFPFDDQHCSMKFGSWTYSGFFTDLRNHSVSVATYQPNGEWQLLDLQARRSIFYYECCPEPYYDVTFTISIRRRTLYYGFNLVLPSMLISGLALLSFTLPADSGEKLNLCVTIFMSLCVFMLMVAEAMPQTSDALPLIEVYFSCVMFEVGASVLCTVIALNFHHRYPETHVSMSPFVRRLLLEWLPWILRMDRPPPFMPMFDRSPKKNKKPSRNLLVEVERSLLRNPLQKPSKTLHLDLCQGGRDAVKSSPRANHDNNYPLPTPRVRVTETRLHASSEEAGELAPPRTVVTQMPNHATTHNNLPPAETKQDKVMLLRSAMDEGQFVTMLQELRIISYKIRKDEMAHEQRADWIFAAMVIDRLCFYSFSSFLFICTFVISYKAPHLFA